MIHLRYFKSRGHDMKFLGNDNNKDKPFLSEGPEVWNISSPHLFSVRIRTDVGGSGRNETP